MNITDLRKGERRTSARRAEDKGDSSKSTLTAVEQEQQDKRCGQDRRQDDRRLITTSEESRSGDSYIRVPINPEIQNLLIDMYSDDLKK